MVSPLAGSLAKTIGKAFAGIFLNATLTRGTTVYPCKAIFEEQNRYFGPSGLSTAVEYKVLVLAISLAVSPMAGDVVTLSGTTVVVMSNSLTQPAVSIDPANAVWTLQGKFVPAGGGGVQATATQSVAALAAAIGTPYTLYRHPGSNPLNSTPVATLPAVFTSAKSSGFSFDKSISYDDLLFAVLADASQLHVGDYLVGDRTFFVAGMPALLPVVAVLCTRVVTVTMPNSERAVQGGQAQGQVSQPGSTGRYRGVSQTIATSGPGETVVVQGIPAALSATAGRATGTGELPTDSAGPSRWRIYLPPSACPKGSIEDRYVITDDEGNRHQVTAAAWTGLGYRVEAIREEN